MKRKWKVLIAVVVLVVGSIAVFAGVRYSHRGIVTVETGRVVRQDLTSLVTASGEIKPRKYINIGANAMGELTEILVKEGDHVRKGQLVARVENTQPEADVNAQRAAQASAEADAAAAEAGLKSFDDNLATMQAGVDRDKCRPGTRQVGFEARRGAVTRASSSPSRISIRAKPPIRLPSHP